MPGMWKGDGGRMRPGTRRTMVTEGDRLKIRRAGRRCTAVVVKMNGRRVLVRTKKASIWMWLEELLQAAEDTEREV